jgi:hypothetical protein
MVGVVPMVMDKTEHDNGCVMGFRSRCQLEVEAVPASRTLTMPSDTHAGAMKRDATDAPPLKQYAVLIVGAGFSGLGLGMRLKETGEHNFAIIERSHQLGGTWAINTYPGCACDVPSHLYSYSFARHSGWSRLFSPQREILQYLESTAEARGVVSHIQFQTDFLGATWLESEALWKVTLSAGECGRWIVCRQNSRTERAEALCRRRLSHPGVES